MSTTSKALEAVAGLLDGLGLSSYDPANPDAAGGPTASTYMKTGPSSPDRVVVLNLVTQGDSRAGDTTAVMLQVRTRGNRNDPLDVDELADSIVPVLNQASINFDGGQVIQLTRRTSTPLGEDAQQRSERVDQFYGDLGLY